MKLKFINLLLASVLLVGSAQVFTSCKDNDADFFAQLKEENIGLEMKLDQRLQKDEADIKKLQGDLAQEIIDRDAADKALTLRIDNILASGGEVGNLVTEVTTVKGDLSTLKDAKSKVDSILNNPETGLVKRVEALENGMSQVRASLSTLRDTTIEVYKWYEGAKLLIPQIQEKANQAYAQATANKISIDSLGAIVATLKNCDCAAALAAIAEVEGKVHALDSIHQADVAALHTEAAQNLAKANAYTDSIFNLLDQKYGQKYDVLNNKVGSLAQETDQIKQDVEQSKQDISDIKLDVAQLQQDMTDLETKLQNQINALDKAIKKNAEEIKKVSDALDEVVGRVEKLENRVSSIELNGTLSPVIGYFSTPVGITSNILLSYSAHYAGQSFKFPTTIDGLEYDGEAILTPADLKILKECGLVQVEVKDGTNLIEPNDGNLGTVYFTINPANINLAGKEIKLVNSQGKASSVELRNVELSNEVLDFGYSRGNSNGFFEADATLAPNASLKDVAITIDPALKDAAYKVYKERNKASIVELAKAAYQQVDGILPALAINTTWSEGKNTYAVNSNYGIAAAVFQPLSYTFLQGKSFRHIPFPDINSDRFHITLSTKGLNIDLPDSIFDIAVNLDQLSNVKLNLNLKMQCHLDELAPVTVTVNGTVGDIPTGGTINPDNTVTLTGTKDVNFTATGDASLESFRKNLNEQLQREFKKNSDSLNAEVERAFAAAMDSIASIVSGSVNGAIKKSVDDMLNSVEDQIDESLADVIDNLNGQINGKIDKVLNRIQRSRLYDALQTNVNRVNKVLDDPNHFMQPVLVYKTTNDVRIASNAKYAPSKLGSSKVTFLATTYNAEIVSPAYMKVLAVTNVYKPSNYNVNAQAGDGACKSALKNANNSKNVNKVLYGQRNAVVINFTKGYVYEITYQAVDYTGRTSTKKYYVHVK